MIDFADDRSCRFELSRDVAQLFSGSRLGAEVFGRDRPGRPPANGAQGLQGAIGLTEETSAGYAEGRVAEVLGEVDRSPNSESVVVQNAAQAEGGAVDRVESVEEAESASWLAL